jgi:hypothetical protein
VTGFKIRFTACLWRNQNPKPRIVSYRYDFGLNLAVLFRVRFAQTVGTFAIAGSGECIAPEAFSQAAN